MLAITACVGVIAPGCIGRSSATYPRNAEFTHELLGASQWRGTRVSRGTSTGICTGGVTSHKVQLEASGYLPGRKMGLSHARATIRAWLFGSRQAAKRCLTSYTDIAARSGHVGFPERTRRSRAVILHLGGGRAEIAGQAKGYFLIVATTDAHLDRALQAMAPTLNRFAASTP